METEVVEDAWQGEMSHDVEYKTSEPLRVAGSIIKMDGRTKTAVALGRGDNVLCIGGGNEGRFIAFFACYAHNQLFNLTTGDFEQGATLMRVIAGGQGHLFPPAVCLDRSTVIRAATYFVENGTMDPALCWESD